MTCLRQDLWLTGLAVGAACCALVACEAQCPPSYQRVGDRCLEEGELDGGLTDRVDSGQPDSGQPDSGQPDSGQPDSGGGNGCAACDGVCFEGRCVAADACSEVLGVPCDAFGPRYIKAFNADENDQFGYSIALSGDGVRLAVGAPFEDARTSRDPHDNDQSLAGAVYVFRRLSNVWVFEAYLKPSWVPSGYKFGSSLAFDGDGDTLAVGAERADSFAGAAFVFEREGGVWMEVAKLTAEPAQNSSYLGRDVALSHDGRVLAAGADYESTSPLSRNGAVHLFEKTTEGWLFAQRLVASDRSVDDYFGSSVDISGDGSVVVVGAPGQNGSARDTNDAGAAYVYERSGEMWLEQAILRTKEPRESEEFGATVQLPDDAKRIAVGAVDGLANGEDSGVVYVFARQGNVWIEEEVLTPVAPKNVSNFGSAVSFSGNGSTVAVGAYGESTGGAGLQHGAGVGAVTLSGAVYVFTVDAKGDWTTRAFIKAPYPDLGDRLGEAVALDDAGRWLAAGAPREEGTDDGDQKDNSKSSAGAGFVYRVTE